MYQKRWFPFFKQQQYRLIHEYLTRPRYIDNTRQNAQTPLQYINKKGAELLKKPPKNIDDQVSLIAWMLDQITTSHRKAAWAAFDLHPEFRFPSYRSKIDGLRLAVMTRLMESAVAAAMYWRS